ncbi:MAG: molybdenum cofactor biosynthesis protein MoaE [Actinobacteria bacterium]|nr:molybdenum cofactor biosynthesis protein MoaE [Actinomycetota bacterium]
MVVVSPDPIDPGRLLEQIGDPGAGAAVLFLGMVRDHSPGRPGVSRLEYEAYGEVVVGKIMAIVAAARDRWPVLGAAIAHRLGSLEVGEITVAVAVACAHRADAFEAGRFLIDEVKHSAPIWKKEHWPGGAEWVREGDSAGA